ncbi:hypothetical protein F4821DRAFT_166082 [Hypoxylon rubiginosum]|uniref:Uncharacterized protein n=1 Tax=Hypoxylon rubiginosum TaxID=110542 RepID=A0ACC0CW83_9PEZI|nr:hypothetical protein F4821DRAFT_166082 [Hypoxylon rubiginosum]
MSSRSGNHKSRYDDPYTFDDPYRHSTSPINNAGYEYVGTDEAPISGHSHHSLSPDPEPRRRPDPSRRYSRTTSPPRHSRHDTAYSPPSRSDRRSSPPRTSHRDSPTPRDGKHHSKHHKDPEAGHRPAIKRTKSLGQHGLKFLGEAAAMYAAAQAGSGDRGRSPSPDRPRRDSRYDSSSRHRHHHRRHSPSPSPSPPRRRSRAHSDAPPRRHHRHRSPSVSDESDYSRDKGRHHRRSRASSYTESPPPRRRSRRAKSVASSVGSSRRGPKLPNEDVAERWQMAARAALEAGGLTAFRLRKEPGKWTGEKGAKVATAALGAAAIDAFIDKDPRRAKSSGGMKGFAENTISSMIASRIMGFKSSSTRKGKARY